MRNKDIKGYYMGPLTFPNKIKICYGGSCATETFWTRNLKMSQYSKLVGTHIQNLEILLIRWLLASCNKQDIKGRHSQGRVQVTG